MKWDRREIKSFRLKYRIEKLKNIFETPQTNAVFLTLNEYSKNDLKKEFIKDGLLLNNVSKKTINYICKDTGLKNLLQGNVIIAQSKNQKLDYQKIIAHKKVKLHFYLANQQIYRDSTKIINTNTTPTLLYNHITIARNNLLKSLYLLKKYNQNSIF
jgi:hypothetical protein